MRGGLRGGLGAGRDEWEKVDGGKDDEVKDEGRMKKGSGVIKRG